MLFFLQRVGFLPARGLDQEIEWLVLEDAQIQPKIDWKILSFTPLAEEDNIQYRELCFL